LRLRPWFNSVNNSPAISPEDWAEPVVPEMSSPTVGEICGKLRIVSGPGAGQEFGVGSRPITIGSGGWCTIVLPDDEGRVGAEEARAWMHQTNRLIFHKLTRLSVLASEGSPGGWLVLQDGDEISVGPCRLAFQLVTVQSEAEESESSAINEALRGFSGGPEGGVASGATVKSREQPVDHGNQVSPWERQPADGASQVRTPEQAVDSVSPARTWEQPADGVISIRSADQDNEDAEDIDEAAG
jgi:hypothetical protein